MRAFIVRRLLLVIPTLFLASFIIFFTIRLVPGDMIDVMASEMKHFTQMDRSAIEQALGLDVPVHIQYARWISGIVLHGDLGDSLWLGTPVIDQIVTKMPITLELSLLGLIVAQLIALPIGILSAVRQDTWGDYVGRSFAILCIAVPAFWLATMVIVFPSIWWGYMLPIEYIPFLENPIDNLKTFIVPAILLGMALSGVTMRMTRAMMLEVLRQDYVRTAWAKGLRERTVVIRHALKNALIPVVTLVGLQMSVLVGGTVIIEQIFGLPGMGRLIVSATVQRDYTVVSGTMLFFGIVMVLINLMVDITYGFLDPRIRYE